MIMTYECTKEFCVVLVDDNGFVKKENRSHVKKGSIWKMDVDIASVTVTAAEIRLENATGLEWIEISRKRLNSHFIQLGFSERKEARG